MAWQNLKEFCYAKFEMIINVLNAPSVILSDWLS